MKNNYLVTWGEGQTQPCSSKTEAIKIATDLLNSYSVVTIKKVK